MPSQRKTFKQFSDKHKHGGNPVEVRGRFLFPDGAMSNGHNHIEPPDEPRALITLQIEYLQAKLQEEEHKSRQPQSPPKENEFAFRERQGCPRILHANRWLYENGAQWAADGGSEPPMEKTAKLKLKVEYLTAAVGVEKQKFDQCAGYIEGQAKFHELGAGPAPEEQAFTDLEHFKKNIGELSGQLESSRKELRELLGPSPAERYQAKRGQQRATASKAKRRARSIEI